MRIHTYSAAGSAVLTHSEVSPSSRMRELLTLEADDIAYRLDEEVELDIDATVAEIFGDNPGHVIVHPCRAIAVTVSYAGSQVRITTAPSTRLKRVRVKAIAEFELSDTVAADLVLRLPGSTDDLPATSPIGVYAPKGTCTAALDLVHLVRPQG